VIVAPPPAAALINGLLVASALPGPSGKIARPHRTKNKGAKFDLRSFLGFDTTVPRK